MFTRFFVYLLFFIFLFCFIHDETVYICPLLYILLVFKHVSHWVFFFFFFSSLVSIFSKHLKFKKKLFSKIKKCCFFCCAFSFFPFFFLFFLNLFLSFLCSSSSYIFSLSFSLSLFSLFFSLSLFFLKKNEQSQFSCKTIFFVCPRTPN